jgi:hypothetical protein
VGFVWFTSGLFTCKFEAVSPRSYRAASPERSTMTKLRSDTNRNLATISQFLPRAPEIYHFDEIGEDAVALMGSQGKVGLFRVALLKDVQPCPFFQFEFIGILRLAGAN